MLNEPRQEVFCSVFKRNRSVSGPCNLVETLICNRGIKRAELVDIRTHLDIIKCIKHRPGILDKAAGIPAGLHTLIVFLDPEGQLTNPRRVGVTAHKGDAGNAGIAADKRLQRVLIKHLPYILHKI